MPIESVNLDGINDGVYRGSFTYGSFTYEVEVGIKGHNIEKIDVISNRDTKYARKAEGVIGRVLEKQSLDVNVVSGASTTSKALLKAIENA
ncbi:MAG TPA: FMN-binding protein [Clostridia bacterium]|nr:FMN-binding protein [Clostridia bacterium]